MSPETNAHQCSKKGERSSCDKNKIDERAPVWVWEACGLKSDEMDWLWETPQPHCCLLWTPAVTNLLQRRHPVSHGWWPQWQAYLKKLKKQLSCPEASWRASLGAPSFSETQQWDYLWGFSKSVTEFFDSVRGLWSNKTLLVPSVLFPLKGSVLADDSMAHCPVC